MEKHWFYCSLLQPTGKRRPVCKYYTHISLVFESGRAPSPHVERTTEPDSYFRSVSAFFCSLASSFLFLLGNLFLRIGQNLNKTVNISIV